MIPFALLSAYVSVLLLGVALSCQINIQFFLHVRRNLAAHGTLCGIDHSTGKGHDKIDVLSHLAAAHDGNRIIAVMNSSTVSAGDTGEGQSRNTLICKGSGIAGVNILISLHAEANFGSHITHVIHQPHMP